MCSIPGLHDIALRVPVAAQIPVLVSDLDLECKMWLKIRLAPMCPWFGTVSLAFVGPPTIKVQLAPYNRVRLMKIPFLQVPLRPCSCYPQAKLPMRPSCEAGC